MFVQIYCSWFRMVWVAAAVIILGSSTLWGQPAWEPATAWQVLESQGQVEVTSSLERRILQVLTPDQARAYAEGQAPETLWLPNGENLAEFLLRGDRQRSAGAAVQTVEPCVLFDETVTGTRPIFAHGAEGCGIGSPVGEVFRAHRTRALILSVHVSEAMAPGSLKLWPGGGSPEPEQAVLGFSAMADQESIPTLIVPICDEESLNPCLDGDLKLNLEGATARVRIVMHGRLHPLTTVAGMRSDASDLVESVDVPSKTTGDSPWIEGTGNIHYLDGKVGIGTASPNSRLVVTEDSTIGGEPKATATIDAAGTSSSEWALSLRASSAPGQVDDLMVVRGDGRVGIGTKSPITDFHLEGQGYVTGDIVLGNNSMIRGSSALSSTAAGAVLFNSATAGPNGIDSNPGYHGYLLHNLFWDGSQWVQPRGTMYSQAFTVGHHYDTSWWRAAPSGTDGSPVSLTRSMVIKRNTGNVGIGSSSNPSSRFVVSENEFSGHSDWTVAFDSRTSDASTGILHLRNSNAESVFFARSDGRLGVGTNTPNATIHIEGSAQVDGSALFRESEFTGTGSASSQEHLFRVWGHHPARIEQSNSLGGDGASAPYFAPEDPTLTLLRGSNSRGATLSVGNQNGKFHLYANHQAMRLYAPDGSTAVQTMTPAGNTGLGVDAPNERLEVDGNVKVSGDLQLSGNLVTTGDICIGQCG